ncbi:MAG: CobW family GTP-binding protein [Pseudomonadales bacterium]
MLENIPTNIITGFLGVGKSTAILKLLEAKPAQERWAVLVNEFGEVGVDGGLLSGSGNDGVFIREVPGGCMCCAAGLPMQIAMNMLLAKAKPDRLLIEPTGLGHPVEVMSVLAAEHYQELLDLRAILTLVDARKISDSRYTDHDTFNQQLQIADVIVASKTDLYEPNDFTRLERYLQEKGLTPDRLLVKAGEEPLERTWLERKAKAWQVTAATLPEVDSANTQTTPEIPDFPPEGFIRRNNHGEGYQSYGWLFEPAFSFRKQEAEALLKQVAADRLKAVLRTEQGGTGFNYAGDDLELSVLTVPADSRIEIITATPFDDAAFESELLKIATR